ncbi:MAG: DUF861 domain-containing protein [Gammaproteobacteria bacterium]|nr:DUF861 domain-containing protein [Gammaproteobacteria bacterium]
MTLIHQLFVDFLEWKKCAPLEYTYTYDDVKIILEGEMTVSEEGGETVDAKPGDIFLYREGAKVHFQVTLLV